MRTVWTLGAAPSPPGPGTAVASCMTSPSPTWPSAGSSSGKTDLSLVNTLITRLSLVNTSQERVPQCPGLVPRCPGCADQL